QLGRARRDAIDKATRTSSTSSYVDGALPDDTGDDRVGTGERSESHSRQTLGGAMFIILVAADLILGFLAGFITKLRADEDYAAWNELKRTNELVAGLEQAVLELTCSVEIAKARCMAGILG